mgnify:CR=1 FL=1
MLELSGIYKLEEGERVIIYNLDSKAILGDKLHRADTFFKRLCGLLPYRSLPAGEMMLIIPCNSVHTCFMRFPIDVLYLNKEGRIVALYENVPPWKLLPVKREACCVLELPAGTIASTASTEGQQLQFSE